MPKLEVEGVTKFYGTYRAIDDLSLDVPEGEIVVLLGASGCGKTTLLRTIGGLVRPDAGTIRIDGRVVASPRVMVPPERRSLSMVFQGYALWPHKTVAGNLAYGLRLRRMPAEQVSRKVENALALVRMDGYADRYPADLSGGQQQRVALARALVLEPKILLFDEPLSNLDAGLREHMRFEIKALLKTLGITGVYVTHDQNEAMVVGDRIAVMAQGRIEQLGTPEEIYHDSRTEFVASFVGLANVFEARMVASAGGDLVTVAVPGLGDIVARAPLGRPEGDAVRLFVRPEAIAFRRSRTDEPNLLHGRIARRTFLGATTDFLVDVNGTSVRVIAGTDDVAYGTDDAALIHLSPHRCLVLAS
jgi:iron(III) transport system ATP-binding protein